MSDAHDPNARPRAPEARRDWTVVILIVTLGALEILVLYLLLFFETPLTPFARRAIETIGGTIALVITIMSVLMFGVAAAWALINKHYKGRDRERERSGT